MKEKLKTLFIEKHGNPDSIEKLDLYLDFVLTYKLDENISYTEKHHILDRASFPEFEKSDWNLVELEYQDHILAHELLFEAYNTRRYQRTLNFNGVKKDSTLISNAAKKGWITLKNDTVKYNKWRDNRTVYLKSLNSEHYSNLSKKFWYNITDVERTIFSKKIKESKTVEVIEKQKASLQKYYENLENREKKSKEAKERWDSLSDQERMNFKEKMQYINSDVEKRKDASNKLKDKWQDSYYLEKMKHRKHKPKNKYQIIFDDGINEEIEGFSEMVEKYNLNAALIRKFLNTGNKVVTKSKRIPALNTVGLIINQI